MQNRRDFIKQASLLIAGGMAMPRLLSSCGGASKKPKKYLGLQLYSLRDMVKESGIQEVLKTVAKMGYTHLETAGYSNGLIYGLKPTEYKKMVEDLGMKSNSCHIGRSISGDQNADMAWWDQAIEAHSAAGMDYIIMPSAPLVQKDGDTLKEEETLDTVKNYGNYFNLIGQKALPAGLKFGYHNHAFEFENKIDGTPVHELLMQYSNPEHVFFQLDVYWIKKGGYDPVDYMKKHADRIQVLHIKDETAIGAQNTVDYKGIFEQAYAGGVIKDWYVEVERYDGPKDTLIENSKRDVQKSADFLLNAEFTK